VIQIRNLIEHWEEWPDDSKFAVKKKAAKKLQYRINEGRPAGFHKDVWGEWTDVQDVHIYDE